MANKTVEVHVKAIMPTCGKCEHHSDEGICKLAALAGQKMEIVVRRGELKTADDFGCNQFEKKE